MNAHLGPLDCPCDGRFLSPTFVYDEPPRGETRFEVAGDYRRVVERCSVCAHHVSRHDMDLTSLYAGDYVDATYGADGLARAFDRILGLPPEASDNVGRVRRIVQFAEERLPEHSALSLLDVGSGTGVFPYAMAQDGWACTALDPDPRAAAHCRDRLGLRAVCADFVEMDLDEIGLFDVVTFNKVLEHVSDPVAMLARSRALVASAGFVYVELPDAEAACREGQGREEFFIEHHHVFSPASVVMLAARAGFEVLDLTTLQEPSTKYTIRAFLGSHRQ